MDRHYPILTRVKNMWAVWLVAVAFVVVCCTQWILRWWSPKSNGVLPPGSMGLPLIGETLQIAIPSYSWDMHPFVKTRVAKYGTIFKTSLVGRPSVVSADPDFNAYIVQQEGRSVDPWSLDGLSKMFVPDTDFLFASSMIHKYLRGITLNQFGTESLKQQLLPVIETGVNSTLESWASLPSVEVKDAAIVMSLDVTGKRMFGYNGKKSPTKLAQYFVDMLSGVPTFPLNIPGTKFHKCLKSMKAIQEELKAIVHERLRMPETGHGDFLDQAIKEVDREKFILEEFIVKLLFVVSCVGIESSSTAVALIIKFLSDNPKAVNQLTAEHEAILKARQNPNSTLTWEEYKSMTFTMQVIKEAMRLGSVAPFVLRKAAKEINFKGYTIPQGWALMIDPTSLQLNPKTYKDPLTFNPWRWEEMDAITISKNFLPYGGGSRQCAGAEYAKLFLSTFLHVLVTKYRWTKLKGGEKVARGFVFRIVDGLHIKVTPKKENCNAQFQSPLG